ncbi:flagellar biosynthetic protein FliR [Enterovibrio norvegicus]|uniref:flagellar biosynthetic protein FliR n=1 Tax=Enterovibrio norvegicus TaxID=188144 RepID=UPI001FD07F0C|nr:flagellar biosynthetic protein FliR [Enterovibrio norvegicus]
MIDNEVAIDWQNYINVFFLILCRVTPPLVFRSINPLSMLPPYIKVLVTIVFSLVIFFRVGDDNMIMRAVQLDGTALAVACLIEFGIGLILWFALLATYGAIYTFLRVLDMQVGFNPMGIFNPSMSESDPILTRVVLVFVFLLFFITDMHYFILLSLTQSLSVFPILSGFGEPDLDMLVALFSSQFTLCLILVLPIMVAVFWVDLVLGMCSRIMPQVNIYFVGLPLKIAVAFIILGLASRHITSVSEELFDNVIRYWQALY